MSKKLVAYFSASGTTAKVAKKMAEAIGADLFEIKPEKPYTGADLNWQNKNSRSSVEMNDRSSRPAIAVKAADMPQYDVVFVGFPVWWYREPSIIDTFVEHHDLDGKLIVPFATSGGSDLGNTYKNIQALAHGASVEQGKVFNRGVSSETLKKWAEKYLK